MAKTSDDKHVHRQLVLTTPHLRGPDVRQFQYSLNGLVDHYEFDWRKIKADGTYGRRTRDLAHFAAWLIGLVDGGRLEVIREQGRITEEVQHLLRNPEKRSQADRAREEDRKPKMRKLRQEHSALREAQEFMLSHKGVTESPPSSNQGPYPIDACQQWYGLERVPWCGCIVGFSIEKIGLGGEKTGTWWPHAETIRLDAEGGRNGLIDVAARNIQRFDVVTMWPGGADDDDHVTWALGAVNSGGFFDTVEGNTSSAYRSSDGGIIETKQHHISEVTCAARLVGKV